MKPIGQKMREKSHCHTGSIIPERETYIYLHDAIRIAREGVKRGVRAGAHIAIYGNDLASEPSETFRGAVNTILRGPKKARKK